MDSFSPVFNQVFNKLSEAKQKSAYKKPTHSAKSRMIPCVLYFFNERSEKKIIIMLHIVFLLALFSLFLDASMIHCIMVLLHSLIYQASVLSIVECLLWQWSRVLSWPVIGPSFSSWNVKWFIFSSWVVISILAVKRDFAKLFSEKREINV